MEELLVENS